MSIFSKTVESQSWSDTASISELYRTPELFSPNGDGVLEDIVVHYRVLEPVHLTFVFYNEAGERVRTLMRDHSEIGVAHTFIWDGRDDQGRVLPDGVYRLEVQNFELSVTLDATPPDIAFTLEEPYQSRRIPGDFDTHRVVVEPAFSRSIVESHYLQGAIEVTSVDRPDAWRPFLTLGPLEITDGSSRLSPVELRQTDRKVFRLVVEDRAGNRAVAESRIPPQLMIHGFGDHQVQEGAEQCLLNPDQLQACLGELGGYYTPQNFTFYAPITSNDGPSVFQTVTAPSVRFAVAESIDAPLTRVVVQYRPLSETDWQELALTEFLDRTLLPNTYDTPLNEAMDIVWTLPTIPPNVTYVVRLKAFDTADQVYMSNAIRFSVEDRLVFLGLAQTASREDRETYGLPAFASPGKRLLWGLNISPEPLNDVQLLMSSPDDPRYQVEQEVGHILQPGQVLLFEVALAACRHYTGQLVGTTPSGEIVKSARVHFSLPCLNLAVKIEPPSSLDCNQPSAQQLHIHFVPVSLNGEALKLLTLARVDSEGVEDVVYNVNRPSAVNLTHNPGNGPHLFVYESGSLNPAVSEPSYNYAFAYDVSALAEGSAQLVAKLIDINDEEIALSIEATIDKTPPSLNLTYPPEGLLTCGVPTLGRDGKIRNLVTISGHLADAYGLHYTLSANGLTIHNSREHSLSPNGELMFNSPDLPPFHLDAISGPLAQLEDENGEVSIQLEAFDWGGFRQCVQRSFVVDTQVESNPPTVSPTVFSPNGDGVADTLSIHHQGQENITLDVHIYAARTGQDGAPEIQGSILRRLETGKLLLSGSALSTWDGLDDSSTTLPDGLYGVVSIYTDTCGNQQRHEAFIELDITPPDAAISYPASDSPLTMLVEIQGSVQDPHLSAYHVQIGAGAAPETWATLQRSENPVLNGVLAQWNTFGVSGEHVLRLVAEDTVGNIRVVDVPLTVADRTYLISALSASPTLFSPNGDGLWEQTSLNIGVQDDVLLTLTVLDADHQLRRTVASEQTAAAGVTTLTWDGLDDAGQPLPDGTYTVALKAVLAANHAVTQEETATVTLDATPPQVEITRPTDGIGTASGQVQGRILDAHLSTYTVSITETPAGPQTMVLSTGTREVDAREVDAREVDGRPLGDLTGLQEGAHILTIEATDEAGNQTVTHVPFTVDNTLPVADLTAPQANAMLSNRQGPIDILGTISDDHFATYTLRFGAGEAPFTWVVLSEGDTQPTSTPFAQWDVGALADGLYTLHLEVLDQAGLQSQVQRLLTVDNTPPAVDLTAPGDGAYVTEAISITGVVTDDHLSSYTLDLALASAPEQRSPMGSGTQAVPGGPLLVWQNLPPNGDYILRLMATDQAGHEAEIQRRVTVDTEPPDAPMGLTVGLDEQGVQLTWQASTASDVVGYIVFRDGQRLTLEPVIAPAYHDTTVSEGRYTYTVAAVDRADLQSQPSLAVSIAVDVTPPTVRLTAPAVGATVSGVVEITGTAYSQEDFKAYRILIGEGATPVSWQRLRQSPVPVQSEHLAPWTTLGLSSGATYTIRLEAEDIHGNVASVTASIIIDNEAPATPTGLNATVLGANVSLSWNANSEADLHGYLVYRDGQLALPAGADPNDLRQAAIPTRSYTDADVPDGPSAYTLAAIDQAGNVSLPSAPVTVDLNARAPHAEWAAPADGETIDSAVYVLATVADRDIAHVRLEYKAVADASWLAMAPADSTAPFDGTFDPVALGLPFGLYDLRAIATDTAAQVDPTPSVITLNYADLVRPNPVQGVAAQVTGADVHVIWSANTEPDLGGYHVERQRGNDTPERLTSLPISEVHYTDTDLADGTYHYTVIAVDTFDNAADASEHASATVYAPVLQPLRTPTRETTVTLSGQGVSAATVSGEIESPTGSTPLPSVPTDDHGQFELTDLPLGRGANRFTVRLTDAEGNVSKDAVATVVSAEPPSAPTGLTAVATNLIIDLTWNANPEPDIAGYLLRRQGQPVLPNEIMSDATADASSRMYDAEWVLDDNAYTDWEPDGDEQGQWLALMWPGARLVSQIELHWKHILNRPSGLDIEAWSGSQWIRLATLQPGAELMTVIDLPELYLTTQLRLVLHQKAGVHPTRIVEFRVFYRPLISETTYADSVSNGRYTYTVSAFNLSGLESQPSAAVAAAAGDVTAPPPVALSATATDSTVELSWTASAASDVQHYALYRDTILLAQITDLQYSDAGLLNGTYRYVVQVVDQVGNISPNSNVVDAVVKKTPPAPPSSSTVASVPTGEALELHWQAGSNSDPPLFQIWRSESSGGPYEVIGQQAESTYTDTGLHNGVTYFYVVVAVDAIGNQSEVSNEASGTPEDQVAPETPRLHFPTVPGRQLISQEPSTTIIGLTDPGVEVELLANGQRVKFTQSLAAPESDALTLDYGVAPSLSPDGRYVAYVETNASSGEASEESEESEESEASEGSQNILRLYDTQTYDIVDVAITNRTDFIHWMSDGTAFIFNDTDDTHGTSMVRQYHLAEATLSNVTNPAETDIDGAAFAPDGRQWAFSGSVQGQHGLWLSREDAGAYTPLVSTASAGELVGTSLRWSPDGVYLTYVRQQTRELVEVATGEVAMIESSASATAASWSPDAQSLIFDTTDASPQIRRYDIDLQASVSITLGQTPQWSPDGGSILFTDLTGRTIVRHELGTGAEVEIAQHGDLQPSTLQVVASGHVGFLTGDEIWEQTYHRLMLSGHFAFNGVSLNIGDQVFSTVAIDPAGNTSSASESILITYLVDHQADLALTATDIQVFPATPRIDDVARVSVTVRNQGEIASSSTVLSLVVVDPDGNATTLLSDEPVAPLVAGGQAAFSS